MDNMSNNSTSSSGKLEALDFAKVFAKELKLGNAKDVVLLNTEKLTDWSRYLIVATFNSLTHGLALLQDCENFLKKEGLSAKISTADRSTEANWLLLDAGDVVIHLMSSEARAFYQLEELWKKAPLIDVE